MCVSYHTTDNSDRLRKKTSIPVTRIPEVSIEDESSVSNDERERHKIAES